MSRDQSLDVARGIAIIAIVVGHVWRGLGAAGLVPQDRTFTLVDNGFYFFHLAVFVFISGLFVQQSVQKRGVRAYLLSREWLFLYLYLLWSVLQGLVKAASGTLSNNPSGLRDILRFWEPEGQLWFLPFLMLMVALVLAYRPWDGLAQGWAASLIGVVASLLMWGVGGGILGLSGLSLTAFYFIGAAVGARRMTAVLRVPIVVALISALVLSAAYGWVLLGTDGTPPTVGADRSLDVVLWGVAGTLTSSFAVLLWSRFFTAIPGARDALAFLGQRSLEIFLAHIIAGSGTRVILAQLGVDSVVLHLVAGTIAGVLAPLILWWLGRQWTPARWLFEPPSTSAPALAR